MKKLRVRGIKKNEKVFETHIPPTPGAFPFLNTPKQ
jgi:hypothetical protein